MPPLAGIVANMPRLDGSGCIGNASLKVAVGNEVTCRTRPGGTLDYSLIDLSLVVFAHSKYFDPSGIFSGHLC